MYVFSSVRKMLSSQLLIVFALVLNYQNLIACDCDWNGGLIKNAQINDLTIHGKVNRLKDFQIRYNGDTLITSVEIEVLLRLKGQDERELIGGVSDVRIGI